MSEEFTAAERQKIIRHRRRRADEERKAELERKAKMEQVIADDLCERRAPM